MIFRRREGTALSHGGKAAFGKKQALAQPVVIYRLKTKRLGKGSQRIVISLMQPGSAVIEARCIRIGAPADAVLRFQNQAG
jgi:hypothetical protein